jgi:hypothetical protein
MQRRAALIGLATLLMAPAAACAQTGMPEPAQSRPGDRPRRPIVEMSFDELPPGRRRRVQQQLAGEGNPPLSPDDARRQWDGMTQGHRRLATRRPDAERGDDRQARRTRREEGAAGDPAMPRRRQGSMEDAPPAAPQTQ